MALDPKAGGRRMQPGKADMEQTVEQAGELAQRRIEELGEVAREQALEWQRVLEAKVREKPLNAVLIAAGVGIVLGLLWRR